MTVNGITGNPPSSRRYNGVIVSPRGSSSGDSAISRDDLYQFNSVLFKKSDVAEYTKATHIEYNSSGQKLLCDGVFDYTVKLKDGTSIFLSGGQKGKNAEREAEVVVDDNGKVTFKGLTEFYVLDTDKKDNYEFSGCDRYSYSKQGQDNIEVSDRQISNGKILTDRESSPLTHAEEHTGLVGIMRLSWITWDHGKADGIKGFWQLLNKFYQK